MITHHLRLRLSSSQVRDPVVMPRNSLRGR